MQAVLKAQINKTDRNDARGIAQMIRVGVYRPVHVKTLRSQKLRMLLTHRKLLQSKAIAIDPGRRRFSGHRHMLSQSRCTCGRSCSQVRSRSNFRISSGFGSARNRCSRSVSRAQASAGGCPASTCCSRAEFLAAAGTVGINTDALE